MHKTIIVDILKQSNLFANTELNMIAEAFVHKTLKKKTVVLSAGNTAREVYFILTGCMRLFYEKEGNDISAYFFTENMFAGAYDSFISQQPSLHSIEALEECNVLAITYKDLQELFISVPAMNTFVRHIIEQRFIELHRLFTSLILNTPEERYTHIVTHRPDLLTRIAQHHIATYIGVTPVSLSRIRNRVARK